MCVVWDREHLCVFEKWSRLNELCVIWCTFMFPYYELCFSNWFPFSACVMLHIPIVYNQNENTFLSVFVSLFL